ncbi:substrate-binding domain-containing protein [Paraferrimonas haliotis]|uniref:Tungsten ABC transporter substrate-binding protein n=1 Tax=Paraferrimonas haliotis TaxID=2013866 RepID=A0AA37TP73_9GAMM|nr:tungsten ABC transporter substrate-binding protein [Paraferrimonas haliotis]
MPFTRRTFMTVLASLMLVLPTSQAMAQDNKTVKLATTTSTENSGLLSYLLPEFTKETGYQVQVIATGTGKALSLGRAGDVDLVMTHAPAAEAKFVEQGFGRLPRQFMENDFVVLGPQSDPAQIKLANSVQEAFARIAMTNSAFLSRGDNSGTNMKELAIWEEVEQSTKFSNYREVGQGMGKTLQMANEMNAYVLADRGTYLAYKGKLNLGIVFEGGQRLANPYQVILISQSKYPHLNHEGAKALSDWLIRSDVQQKISDFKVSGEQLFKATYQAK